MSDLPDVEATVNLLKAILSEGVDLASEKTRRFQGFLQDYAGRARVEQSLNLERKHLNVLMRGMRYPRFDAVVAGREDAAGLNGLGDWLARQEGYDKGLCQWVEVVWSKSLGLATDIELDSNPIQSGEVFRDRLRDGGGGPAMVVLPTGRFRMGDLYGDGYNDEWPVRTGEVFRDRLRGGREGPAMVVLPTGRFRMGDLYGDGYNDERPVHTVTISRRIAMGQYPVTFEDYDLYFSAMRTERPGDEGWGRGRRPVIYVSQEDAKAYAAWLSAQTGKTYRLPSESEWEYAARAGTETAYSWGDEINCGQARYGRRSGGECSDSLDGTAPVGSFAANAFGLYDMHGNVWEWVEDCWHDNYEGAPTDGSAWTTNCGWYQAVVRGGSWYLNPRGLRSANRFRFTPSARVNGYGFRLVQDLKGISKGHL